MHFWMRRRTRISQRLGTSSPIVSWTRPAAPQRKGTSSHSCTNTHMDRICFETMATNLLYRIRFRHACHEVTVCPLVDDCGTASLPPAVCVRARVRVHYRVCLQWAEGRDGTSQWVISPCWVLFCIKHSQIHIREHIPSPYENTKQKLITAKFMNRQHACRCVWPGSHRFRFRFGCRGVWLMQTNVYEQIHGQIHEFFLRHVIVLLDFTGSSTHHGSASSL